MLPRHADDLAQEIWMDVYRDLPALADPGAFLPWLYRIAHHRIFRQLRGRRRAMSDIENLDVADDEPADFTAEDAQAVHAAMDQLEPAHREVLLLKFIQNMSYEQIAMVIQRPIGTVRSRVHHAKRQLKAIIERQISHEPK
jgi:RNA polymerase sigma-70 factor (ECF subfamily)